MKNILKNPLFIIMLIIGFMLGFLSNTLYSRLENEACRNKEVTKIGLINLKIKNLESDVEDSVVLNTDRTINELYTKVNNQWPYCTEIK